MAGERLEDCEKKQEAAWWGLVQGDRNEEEEEEEVQGDRNALLLGLKPCNTRSIYTNYKPCKILYRGDKRPNYLTKLYYQYSMTACKDMLQY